MKVDMETAESVLRQIDVPPNKVGEFRERIEQMMRAEKEQREAAASSSGQQDPPTIVALTTAEVVGQGTQVDEIPLFVFRCQPGIPHTELADRVRRAAADQNEEIAIRNAKPRVRRRADPLETIGHAVEEVKASIWKRHGVKPVSKDMVIITQTQNQL